MRRYNESENAWVGGIAGTKNPIQRITPGEIELMVRRMRATIVADGLVSLIVATIRAIGWLARPLVAWWNRSQVHDELMSMDDRMLADIGISRAEIPAVAAGRYPGETTGREWRGTDSARRMPSPALPVARNDHRASPKVA